MLHSQEQREVVFVAGEPQEGREGGQPLAAYQEVAVESESL